jgi:hypothetical protein
VRSLLWFAARMRDYADHLRPELLRKYPRARDEVLLFAEWAEGLADKKAPPRK